MKVIKKGEEGRTAVLKGMNEVADLVKGTYGPNGTNVALERRGQAPLITNDGFTIVNDVELEDEIENIGAQYVKYASRETNKTAGDGTTGAIILTQAISNNTELGGLGGNEMEARRKIMASCDEVIEKLDEMAKPIKKIEDIENVASISAESHKLGAIVAEAIEKVGKHGSIQVEETDGKTEAFVTQGFEIQKGYVAPTMITDPARMRADYKNVPIMVCNTAIKSMEQLGPFLQRISAQGINKMVIVADAFEGNTLQALIIARLQGQFSALCLETPGFGNRGEEEIIDLATAVGATVIEKIEEATPEMLGKSERVISDADTTIFRGTVDTKERIALLENQIESSPDKEWVEGRIAQLAGGVGVVRVGGATKGEREYKVLKIEDAINATQAAIEEGVVPGGGLALKEIAESMTDGNILKEALMAPYNQIQANGTLKIPKSIVDPVKVVKEGLKNACSVAGTLITTKGAVADKIKEDD